MYSLLGYSFMLALVCIFIYMLHDVLTDIEMMLYYAIYNMELTVTAWKH
jgi:hypothetical protein